MIVVKTVNFFMLLKELWTVKRHYKTPLQLKCRRSVWDLDKTLQNIMLAHTGAWCTLFLKPSKMRTTTNQHSGWNRDLRELEVSQKDCCSVILLIIHCINAQSIKEVEESWTVSAIGQNADEPLNSSGPRQ